MVGSLRIDVNGTPRTVGRDQYTVPTRYGTTSGARRPDRSGRPAPGDDSPQRQARTRSIVAYPRGGTPPSSAETAQELGFDPLPGKRPSTPDARSVGFGASSAPSPSAGGGRSAVPD